VSGIGSCRSISFRAFDEIFGEILGTFIELTHIDHVASNVFNTLFDPFLDLVLDVGQALTCKIGQQFWRRSRDESHEYCSCSHPRLGGERSWVIARNPLDQTNPPGLSTVGLTRKK
jgi:hypothetical protein